MQIIHAFSHTVFYLLAVPKLAQGAQEFVVHQPDATSKDHDVPAGGSSDLRINFPETSVTAQHFTPVHPSQREIPSDEIGPLLDGSILQKMVARNTALAEQKSAGFPVVNTAAAGAETFPLLSTGNTPPASSNPKATDSSTTDRLAGQNFQLRGAPGGEQALQKEKSADPFYFLPQKAPETVMEPNVAKDITFSVPTTEVKEDESPGFFTKAVRTVVDTVKSFSKDPTQDDSKLDDTRAAINDQLISILEKRLALLKATGQKDKEQETTTELLEAYADMAANLKESKMSLK